MARKYAHLSTAHLADYVDRVAYLRVGLQGRRGYDSATRAEVKRPQHALRPFVESACPAGFEPPTPWFVGDSDQVVADKSPLPARTEPTRAAREA